MNDQGKTIVMVTHDVSLTNRFSRSLTIADGEVFSETEADKSSGGAEMKTLRTKPER